MHSVVGYIYSRLSALLTYGSPDASPPRGTSVMPPTWLAGDLLTAAQLPMHPAERVAPESRPGARGLWPSHVPSSKTDSRDRCSAINATANRGTPYSSSSSTARCEWELGRRHLSAQRARPDFPPSWSRARGKRSMLHRRSAFTCHTTPRRLGCSRVTTIGWAHSTSRTSAYMAPLHQARRIGLPYVSPSSFLVIYRVGRQVVLNSELEESRCSFRKHVI